MIEAPINQTTLSGQIVSIDALRYTPSGIATQQIILWHRSRQTQCSGVDMLVELKYKVFLSGNVVDQFNHNFKLNDQICVKGFLKRQTFKETYQSVLYAQSIDLVEHLS